MDELNQNTMTLSESYRKYPVASAALVLLVHVASNGKSELVPDQVLDESTTSDLDELERALNPAPPYRLMRSIVDCVIDGGAIGSEICPWYKAIEPLRHLIGSIPSIAVSRAA